LERASKKSRISLSQEVEGRLRVSFNKKKAHHPPRISALGAIVVDCAKAIETATRRSWREDRFTGEAVLAAVTVLVGRLLPEGEVEVPPMIEMSAKNLERFVPEQVKAFREPAGFGASLALGYLDALMIHEVPATNDPNVNRYGDNFLRLPRLRTDLGLKRPPSGEKS
jgi:hypothetical protein